VTRLPSRCPLLRQLLAVLAAVILLAALAAMLLALAVPVPPLALVAVLAAMSPVPPLTLVTFALVTVVFGRVLRLRIVLALSTRTR
jgi:hypothetical protein